MVDALEFSVIMSSFVLVLMTVLASALFLLAKRFLEERAAEVDGARELLDAHFAALDRINDDPAVSDQLKDMLISFSVSVTRQDIALACALQVQSKKLPLSEDVSKKMTEVSNELKELSHHRPDLRDAVVDTVVTGFTSMMMRWPATREAVVRLHVANTLRKPLSSRSKELQSQDNGVSETIDYASRVFAARNASFGVQSACAA